MQTKLVLVVLLLNIWSSTAALFEVLQSPWSTCGAINDTQTCFRTREASCVFSYDNATAPWYYCENVGSERPSTVEVCAEGSCVQDCGVTEWSDWSDCVCTESFYSTRTRQVVVPPRNGGASCPSLLERRPCRSCINNAFFEDLPREYTWRTGSWGSCQPLDTTRNCGSGLQTRQLQCVGVDGRTVDSLECFNEELAYASLTAPPTSKLCSVPCDCVVGGWSPWSQCQSVCESPAPFTARVRTRSIARLPSPSGSECPPLVDYDEQACSEHPLNCSVYTWVTSDWTVCRYYGNAECGDGYRTRYLYCQVESNGLVQHVDQAKCDAYSSSDRPEQVSHCHTQCRQACVLGAWSSWSECAPSCKETHSNRTREVLVPPRGEEVCPHTIELRPCPVLEVCVQWIIDPFFDCYLQPGQECGAGVQSRRIECGDLQGNVIEYSQCSSQLPTPTTSRDCYVPCPNDCVVSDWTPWTPCSHTCGEESGSQTRTRQIIAAGINCMYTNDDLFENRTCVSLTACEAPTYHTEVGVWSECREVVGSGDSFNSLDQSRSCVYGVRNRTTLCVYGDQVVPTSECPIQYTAAEQESCELSCDQDCTFSAWSDYSPCSVTCGVGTRTRSRLLLQFPEDPQRVCSDPVDENGVQEEIERCVLEDCPVGQYQWVGDNWSDCMPFQSVELSPTCGLGYQTTPLSCVNDITGESADAALCSHLAPPPTARSCVVPCPDRCILTEWTDYSTCENGQQNRTRRLVPTAMSSSVRDSCPWLANLPLTELVPCRALDLSQFDYSVFTTFSMSPTIISDPLAVCGNGEKVRSVACIDMTTLQVYDEEYCAGRERDRGVESASIKCDRDCDQSDWSDWSSCSSSCGYGTRTRTRRVLRRELKGGHVCGPNMEVDVCNQSPCLYPRYEPGPFSSCRVSNTSLSCGPGTRTRQPLCLVNGVIQETSVECDRQGLNVTFDLSESCVLPCPGECVVSEWSEWTMLSTSCLNGMCQYSRSRSILRVGVSQCPMTQDHDVREPEDPRYQWMTMDWGTCVVGVVGAGAYCGQGVRRRAVECMDSVTGQTVYGGMCEEVEPHDEEACSVPCPVDCVVGAFSEWSRCPERCEAQLVQWRARAVVTPQAHGGRACPELNQTRICPPTNCTVYEVSTTRTPHCDIDLTPATQCGTAVMSKPLSCRRNTQYVDLSICRNAIAQGLSVVGSALLDPVECTVDCPLEPECVYSEWSDWSECTALCADKAAGFRFRVQTLISSHPGSRDCCEGMQYNVSECDTPERIGNMSSQFESCVSFEWQSSEFNRNDTRDVWCVMGDSGVRVSTGCSLGAKPPAVRRSCDPTSCPAHSMCVADRCECLEKFEMVNGDCLPLTGCASDSHCFAPNTECVNEDCVCKDNFEFSEMNGICEYIAPLTPTIGPTNMSQSTPDPTPGTSDTPGTAPPTEAGQLGILEVVLIATVPLVVIILIVVILIVIMHRCRRSLERRHDLEKQRRSKITISAPSPVHSLNRYDHHRGADSASSGFVDDLEHDQFKFGMVGKTFLGSQRGVPLSREDIDEAAFTADFPAQAPSSPNVRPVPVAVPTLPGYQLEHIALDYRPRDIPTDVPDGDFTTDITYTTDDGSLVTTSVPPSSQGSPSVPRRHLPPHLTHQSQPAEGGYVSMHPVYSQVTPRSQRSQRSTDRTLEDSQEWERSPQEYRERVPSGGSRDYRERLQSSGSPTRSHDYRERSHDHQEKLPSGGSHDYRERLQSSSSPTRSHDYRERSHDHRERLPSGGSHDYRGRLQSNGSYDYREYRGMSHDHGLRSHDERGRSRSAGKDHHVYEHERQRYYSRRDHRSLSPQERYQRDRGIATGLDNSLVQAITQMGVGGSDAVGPAQNVRSAGNRGSHRRRRRRHHGQPRHMTYHHHHYNSDGPSDHELTSASEAEQGYHSRRLPSRSLPISPVPLDPNEPDYDTLPHPPIHVKPATPPSRRVASPDHTPRARVASPDHTPRARVAQLRVDRQREGHYDYPRYVYNTQQLSQGSTSPPPPQPTPPQVPQPTPPWVSHATRPSLSPESPPTQPTTLSPPAHLLQATPTTTTRYEHLAPLKLASVEGSPLSSRRHPPSPLALHSEGAATPRSSGEVTTSTFGHSQDNQ